MASRMNTNEGTMKALKIPNLDLRSFCQDELHLAAYFSRPFSKATFADVVIPTVDKTLFNPSVGSRKQTYSRRSRGRSRAEQNFSLSLSSQSRAGIQLTVAKQFKDSTAEILASASTKLLSSSLRNIRKVTSLESCLDEPRNLSIRDLDYRNDETSGRMVVGSGERLCVARGPALHTCESELLLEKRFSDGGLSGNASIITKLVVNSDIKRVEAPSEGEEVTLQQKLQRTSEAVGKEAEAEAEAEADADACLETCTAQRPIRKEVGGRKRLVSEITREEGLWREVEGMGHEISNAASLFLKNKIRGKRSEVPKRLAIKLQDKRVEEEASLILQPLPQRGESKSVDFGKEAVAPVGCGNECRMSEYRQVRGGSEAQIDKKELCKEHVSVNEKEAVMLECLSKMEGMWLSNQTAMKVVDAKGFPKGWKVTIGLNRDNGQIFFEYHNYRSPDGKLWPSFKEASQYLLYEVKKLPIFSAVQSINLIYPDQLDQAHVKGGVCETIAQTVSRLSDDVVLQNLQPSLTKHLESKKGFRKVEKGINKPEISRVYHTEDVGAESRLKGEMMEKDARQCSLSESALNVVPLGNEYCVMNVVPLGNEYCVMNSSTSEQALSVEPQHLVGWNDKGCALCKMAVDSFDLCMCNWCENEFHIGCVEASSCCVNERSLLCPCCRGE